MTKRTISLTVLIAALAASLFFTPDVLLIIFAGILLGVLIGGSGHWIAVRLGIANGWGVAFFLFGIVVAFSVFGAVVAPSVVEQVDELTRRLPEAFESFRERIEEFPWGSRLLDRLTPEDFASWEGRSAAMSVVSSTFGALGNTVIILFIGLYAALDPGVYRRGFLFLLAPSIRDRGGEVLQAATDTLRN